MTELNVDLDYEEQQKWTKICEMYTYLSRIDAIDEEQWRMIKVLSDGFVGLMDATNKNKVLDCLLDLFHSYVERDQNFDNESI